MIRKNTSVDSRKSSTSAVPKKTEGETTVARKPFVSRTRHTAHTTNNSGSRAKYKNLHNAKRATKLTSIAPANDVSKNLRIIPIGGCEEVGRNMTIFEYDGDAVIIDMGIQFPEEDMPGIDYIIPNVKYLEKKIKNIRGVVFTHGHLDHIGAAPILLEKLGNPVIVGKDLTLALIKHKQEDYKKGTAKNLRTIRVQGLTDVVKLGKFTVKFFQVEHSIMDAVGVILETPSGTIIHPGDWTLARDINGVTHINYDELSKLPKPTVLMLESLGSTNDKRHGIYEEIYKNIYNLLSTAPGRVIIGTFSSQLERVRWILESAEKLDKKVALDGYSMKMNVQVAQELGYIKSAKNVLIDIKDLHRYPENKVVVVCTGAQGEKNAVLMRIVNKQHRFVQLKKHDTVVFSSSIIPGNERSIQRLKDNMYRQCDNVIHGEIMEVHVSGHATREDIMTMINQIKPTYFIPVYANYYFLREAEQLALKNGFPKERIFVPDNGSIIEVNTQKAVMLDRKAPSDYVFVDGLGVSDNQNIVLRDRQVLAGDGMLVVIATIDSKTGTLIQNPDIISRGFVFLKDNKDLIEEIRNKVKQLVIKSDPKTWVDSNQIRNDIRDKIGQFVLSKTEKRPMMLPVIIEV
ncbi:TPA: ribonuclease J [Candidatus Magasanikbacteria bacterium]|nr:ribonuclease J [Candidatus Magasanikbacteria bacterium]